MIKMMKKIKENLPILPTDILHYRSAKAMFDGFVSFHRLDDAIEKSIPFEVAYGDSSISTRAIYIIINKWARKHGYVVRTYNLIDHYVGHDVWRKKNIDQTKKELYIIWVDGLVWFMIDDFRKAVHTDLPDHVIYVPFLNDVIPSFLKRDIDINVDMVFRMR